MRAITQCQKGNGAARVDSTSGAFRWARSSLRFIPFRFSIIGSADIGSDENDEDNNGPVGRLCSSGGWQHAPRVGCVRRMGLENWPEPVLKLGPTGSCKAYVKRVA